MTPGARIERVRPLAQAVDRMRRAQDHYWSLRSHKTDAARGVALARARELEGEVDERLARLGLGRQQLLPGSDLEPPGYVRGG